MLRRVQCTYPRVSWLAVVPLAIALVSCGGSPVGDSVTGPSVVAVPLDSTAPDVGTVSESGKKPSMVLLCHKGRDKWVPPSAVGGHLRHGDSLGSCSAPSSCPCFSTIDLQTAAGQCTGTVNPTCDASAVEFSLVLACDPGGTVPPNILGIYLTKTADGGSCTRIEPTGSFTKNPLTEAQYDACAEAITDSGYCF